jgi:hypothetical protein
MSAAARNSLLSLAILFLGLLLLSSPAQAEEKKGMGDVLVPEGESWLEASTGWGNVTVEGEVAGDVRSGFGNVEIEGPVDGRVEVGVGEVYVNDRVEGEIKVGQGSIELGPEAVVNDLVVGNGSITQHDDAVVNGAESVGASSDFRKSLAGGSALPSLSELLGWTLMTLGLVAVGALLAVLVPRPLAASARSLEVAPGRSFLLGLASLPGAFILCVLLAVTVVGIPVLLLAVPAYLALVVFGAVVVAYFLGRRILLATGGYRAGDVAAVGLGAVLVSAVYLVPLLGGLALFLVALLGTGAALSAALSRRHERSYPSYEAYLRDRRGL